VPGVVDWLGREREGGGRMLSSGLLRARRVR
jgi:hypothetical protein